MKITQEQIDNMETIDRIDYNLRRQNVDKNYDMDLGSIGFINHCLIPLGAFIVLLSTILISTGNIETGTNMFLILGSLFRFSCVVIPVLIFIDIFVSIRYKKAKRELDSKYFEIKTKGKKKC